MLITSYQDSKKSSDTWRHGPNDDFHQPESSFNESQIVTTVSTVHLFPFPRRHAERLENSLKQNVQLLRPTIDFSDVAV